MADKDALEDLEARLVELDAVVKGFKAYCEYLPIIGPEGAHCMFDLVARSHILANRPARDPDAVRTITLPASAKLDEQAIEDLMAGLECDDVKVVSVG